MITKSLFIYFLFLFNLAFGQVIQNGLILPEQRDEGEICCIYVPEDGFTVYNQPNGEIIGIKIIYSL